MDHTELLPFAYNYAVTLSSGHDYGTAIILLPTAARNKPPSRHSTVLMPRTQPFYQQTGYHWMCPLLSIHFPIIYLYSDSHTTQTKAPLIILGLQHLVA